MSAPHTVRNALGFAYSALRDHERYIEGSHKSHYELFVTRVSESVGGAAAVHRPISNSEVESFYLGNVSEESFVRDLSTRVPQLASASSPKPLGGSTEDVLLTAVWELYRSLPSHAQLCSKVNSATGRLLWEMFLALDTRKALRIDTEAACEVILHVFQANGHLESEENIREWFCEERQVDFISFFTALVENYASFLQPSILQELHRAVTSEALKSGKMKKKGHVVQNWKERVFILRETSLAYFDENGVQKGMVTINANTQVNTLTDPKHRFKVVDGTSGVVYEIQTSDRKSLLEWMSMLNLAITMHKVKGTTFLQRLRLAKQQLSHTTPTPSSQTSPVSPGTVNAVASPSGPDRPHRATEKYEHSPERKAASAGAHRPLSATKSVPISPPPYAVQNSRQLPKVPSDQPVVLPTREGDFTDGSLNDAPPVPPRRFLDDNMLNLQPSHHTQVVPRRLRKSQTTDEDDEAEVRRHSSILGESDMPSKLEVKHVTAGHKGQSYALVTKFKTKPGAETPQDYPFGQDESELPPAVPDRQGHPSPQEHQPEASKPPPVIPHRHDHPSVQDRNEALQLPPPIPNRHNNHSGPKPPVSPNTRRKELDYARLNFHDEPGGKKGSPAEIPRDVRTRFAYTQVVFDNGPQKDTEAAQELKRRRKQPPLPPKYEGKGMHKVKSDSKIGNAAKTKTQESKKSGSLPDLTEDRGEIPRDIRVDYADVDFTLPPIPSSPELASTNGAREGDRLPPGALHPQPKPRGKSHAQVTTKQYENMTFDGAPCPPPRASPRKGQPTEIPPPVPARKTN